MRIDTVWIGRGGQGIVTAVYIVAHASIADGFYALANPEFGAERRGAPVKAFLRISDTFEDAPEPIKTPDVAVILDDKLIDPMRVVIDAVKPGGYVLVSSGKDPEKVAELIGRKDVNIAVVDGIGIALKHVKLAVPNGPMVGVFARVMGFPKLQSIKEAIESQLGKAVEQNFAAAEEAYKTAVIIPATEQGTAKAAVEIPTTSAFLTGDYELVGWDKIPEGGLTYPGSSLRYKTGSWRVEKPIIDHSKCIMCRKCWMFCPDDAVLEVWRETKLPSGRVVRVKAIDFSYEYCKGCGICADVCPTGAIQMVREI
ncbi:2-oxoacid:acceptor oxidoreductase family protein [Thermoproteus tenax]|uniref:pyruvate synthase n=2 Tax=Thermoproteus tenax TaxID=2271 RepID=G4RMU3_THETK|nr:2-oxoacid:acceptor oxidoreductase family protein [Thermoproteus tenax]CAF18519.1 2-oxoglutarate synthase, 2-oxoacid-ferredoxin oxidoreductase CD subunit [Thermoproteus tenax]CCC80887.1 2-oxoacid ferredoxin oxidoreductase, gamma-delta subunit [Thermoproteus tenax Kra 1]